MLNSFVLKKQKNKFKYFHRGILLDILLRQMTILHN